VVCPVAIGFNVRKYADSCNIVFSSLQKIFVSKRNFAEPFVFEKPILNYVFLLILNGNIL
jgi:hypothetical protein